MRILPRLLVACVVAALSFGAVACKGKLPDPPKQFQVAETAKNKAQVSVDAFEVTTPDFVNSNKQAMRPMEGQGMVAVVRLKIHNPTSAPITYKPLHYEDPKNGIQLCTKPNEDNGDRQNFKSVTFDASTGIHTTNQTTAVTEIPANGTLYDDYLFEIPVVEANELVVLVPGSVVGDVNKTYRFAVPGKPKKVEPEEPKGLNEMATIDGLSVKITKVSKEYAQLDPKKKDKVLKYPYAYTKEPILVVRMTITNTSGQQLSYEPSHTAEAAGIILEPMGGGEPFKRIKLDASTIGKGQVMGKIAINDGESIEDVYFFETPGSDQDLVFNISGHIFSVRGMYRFVLPYVNETPKTPDLEPYKRANAAKDDEDADKAGEDGVAEDGAKADDAKPDDAKADDAKADDAKADDAKG